MENISQIVEQWGVVLGFILPYIQLHMNQAITKDIKIGKKIKVTVTEQRIALTGLLSLLAGLIITALSGKLDLGNFGATAGLIFSFSQVAYYAHFRKLITPEETKKRPKGD